MPMCGPSVTGWHYVVSPLALSEPYALRLLPRFGLLLPHLGLFRLHRYFPWSLEQVFAGLAFYGLFVRFLDQTVLEQSCSFACTANTDKEKYQSTNSSKASKQNC